MEELKLFQKFDKDVLIMTIGTLIVENRRLADWNWFWFGTTVLCAGLCSFLLLR